MEKWWKFFKEFFKDSVLKNFQNFFKKLKTFQKFIKSTDFFRNNCKIWRKLEKIMEFFEKVVKFSENYKKWRNFLKKFSNFRKLEKWRNFVEKVSNFLKNMGKMTYWIYIFAIHPAPPPHPTHHYPLILSRPFCLRRINSFFLIFPYTRRIKSDNFWPQKCFFPKI